jgi:hypothetical protein
MLSKVKNSKEQTKNIMNFEIRSKSMGTEQRKIKRQHKTKVRLLYTLLCFACGTQRKYTNPHPPKKYIIGETKDYEIKVFANHRKNTHTLQAIRIFSAANLKH